MIEYRLPDGSVTENCEDYYREWDALIIPFQKMGFKLVAYNPGLQFSHGEFGRTFNLPASVAKRIVENLKEG